MLILSNTCTWDLLFFSVPSSASTTQVWPPRKVDGRKGSVLHDKVFGLLLVVAHFIAQQHTQETEVAREGQKRDLSGNVRILLHLHRLVQVGVTASSA